MVAAVVRSNKHTVDMASYRIASPDTFNFAKLEEWHKWICTLKRFWHASGLNTKSQASQVNTLIYYQPRLQYPRIICNDTKEAVCLYIITLNSTSKITWWNATMLYCSKWSLMCKTWRWQLQTASSQICTHLQNTVSIPCWTIKWFVTTLW